MAEYRRILVTGGAGFIGSNFVRFALRQRPDVEVINFDSLTYSGNLDNIADLAGNSRYRFVHGSICDADLSAAIVADCDAIVHMAAESHVDRSIVDSRPFILTNVLGTQTLLDAARRAGGRRLLHVSTDEVYGSLPLDRPELKFTEATPIAPNSPYAASKAASDLLVRAAHETFGADAVITRCSNNFGPYQYPEKVIPLFVTNLLEGKKVPLYAGGQNVRDWVHVEDHCRALWAVLENGRPGEAYNIGADNEHSNLELTHALLVLLGKGDEMIQRVQDRPGHDLRYAIDSSKIRRELGWRATCSAWPEALERTVRWYVDHPQWWRKLKGIAARTHDAAQARPPAN